MLLFHTEGAHWLQKSGQHWVMAHTCCRSDSRSTRRDRTNWRTVRPSSRSTSAISSSRLSIAPHWTTQRPAAGQTLQVALCKPELQHYKLVGLMPD